MSESRPPAPARRGSGALPRAAAVLVAMTAALCVAGASLAASTGSRGSAGSAATAAATRSAAASDAGRRAVLAARWPLSKADTDYYKMVILPDGYPGKKVGSKVVPHPIYGVYLIRAFTQAFEKSKSAKDRKALQAVSRAAVARMRTFRGGLVFWYDPVTSVPLNRAGVRAYSALTQAYYTEALLRAGRVLKDVGLRRSAGKVFASLLVPTSRGGVSSPGKLGPVLEEEPTTVPSAILNGWLSALTSVRTYAELTGSKPAAALVRASAREAARRLPRYDVPQVLGSSYSGLAYLTLRLDVPVGTSVRSGVLAVDKRSVRLRLAAGTRASDVVQVLRCGRRVGSTVVATCRGLQLDVPVTSAGISGVNSLRLLLKAPARGRVSGSVSRGVYRYVHDKGRTVTGWTGRRALSASSGTTTLSLAVTAAQIRAALVPTTFKHYGGRRTNVYHTIHISRLTALAQEGGPAFTTYASRWREQMCRWAKHPAYVLIPRKDLTCPSAPKPAAATGGAAADLEVGVSRDDALEARAAAAAQAEEHELPDDGDLAGP